MTSHHAESIPDLVPRLRAVVARVAGEREADDLVQDCCVRLLEKEHLYRGVQCGFGAFAGSVARNLARNLLRRPRRGLEDTMEDPSQVAATAPTIDEERVGWILDQLGRLPDEQRELLRLRYYDALTVDEVGQRLGISQAAASKRLAIALERLQQRARAQGLLGSFLPASWATGLASTNAMKLTLVGAASTVTLGLAATSFFLPDPATPIQGSTAEMAGTTFAASLETALDPRQNTLWCGTFKLAWEAFLRELPSVDLEALSGTLAAVQAGPFRPDYVDPASYVAVGGLDPDEHPQLELRHGDSLRVRSSTSI